MTEKEIRMIIKKFRVPENIVKHMEKVARIALFLGTKLKNKGEKVDLKLLKAASRLHDIFKLCDFKAIDRAFQKNTFSMEDEKFWGKMIKKHHKDGHIKTAYDYFIKTGEPVIAEIIKKHDYLSPVSPKKEERPSKWEEKLLYYADKRILHDKLVSIGERIKDGRKRYHGGKISPEDKKVEREIYLLEKEIMRKAGATEKDIENLF